MRQWLILGAVLLAGCASGELIQLAYENGHRVQCGPYDTVNTFGQALNPEEGAVVNRSAESKLRSCVEDFQRRGYAREDGILNSNLNGR